MAVIESWVIDGVALTSGAFTLMELTADPPKARMDWITAADSEDAALFRQPLHENRTITMKLRVTPQASMDAALDQVAALVDKLRKSSATRDGVALVWTPTDSARARTFDVVAGEITGMPISLSGDGYSWVLHRPIVTVELTAKPYWRGTETLTTTASSSTPFVAFEIAGVTGDVPALGRLIITDTATQSRRHVEWGLEGPLTYNSGTSLIVDSDNMVTSGFAGAQSSATAGAYDPNASGNSSILATALLNTPTAVCGTGNLSHVGVFRVKARVIADYLYRVRLTWQSADGPLMSNAWATPVVSGSGAQWTEVDLGVISIPATVVGTQRWTGRIEVYHTTGSFNFVVDYLTLVPVSDGYGKARASYSYQPGLVAAQDAFVGTTAAAALNARVAPLGGTWATSGDATDFLFADTFNGLDTVETIARSSSAIETTGRFAILGSTNYTDTQVDVRSRIGTFGTSKHGPIARWVDASNHLRVTVPSAGSTNEGIKLEMLVAGTPTTLAQSSWARTQGVIYRFRLSVFASGRAIAQVLSDAGQVLVQLDANSSVLATSGTLASGKPGLYDRSVAALGEIRRFTEFAVSTPPAEPIVLYSGRNMQVRYDDTIRQDSTATYTGRPQSYQPAGRFLVPVGTSRVLVKARRNDIDTAADDTVTDALQIQVGWTPRGLAVPRA